MGYAAARSCKGHDQQNNKEELNLLSQVSSLCRSESSTVFNKEYYMSIYIVSRFPSYTKSKHKPNLES